MVFGWVFASHMVGAGVAASFAGWIRTERGDYFIAWMTAGALCLAAAAALPAGAASPAVPRRGAAERDPCLMWGDSGDPPHAGNGFGVDAHLCQDSPVAPAGLPGCDHLDY